MTETIRKKLMAGVLVLALTLSFIPAVPLTAEAADIIPSTSLSGSGTADVPFEIASAADLAYMRNQVNDYCGKITPSGGGDGVDAKTASYKLTADIVLGYWKDDNSNGIVDAGEIYNSASGGTAYSASNWTPIGSSSTYDFAGTFDGADHTVSGIYINATSDYQGLFGYVGGGTVKDVGVKDSYIKGGSKVGGIAGDIAGSKGTIQNSYNTGSVSGVNNVGGVVGYNYGSSVYSAYPSVQNSYNTGSISGTANVGGVAGSNSGTATGCYYDKQMCPAGGINGGDIGESAEGKTTLEMTSDAAFSGWSSGETGTWNFTSGLYPRLTGYVDAGTDYYMDETDAAFVSSSPVFLADTDTAATVKSNFTLSTENAVSWSSSDGSIISITGSNAIVAGQGTVILTASRGDVTKNITLAVDTIAPTLNNAVRNSNTQITVTLSESCVNLAKENDGGFTVTKTGTGETFMVSQTAQGANASQVVLTVADMATAGANGVTVTYTAGANGTITDIAGNPLATNGTGVVITLWAINAATVNITAPAAGAAPQTAAEVEAATVNADYTVTNLVWNEALTAGDKFKAGQVYTAEVTLTSKNGKEFQAAAFTPVVESASSVGTTTTAGTGTGNTVTFTVTFAATEAQSVTAVAVKTQPAKLNYTEGELLDLAGLVVTLTYNDGSSADIPYAQFGANGITADLDQGTAMEIAAHNGQAVTLTCNAHTATTNTLTVSPPPTYEITLSETGTYTFTAQTAGYTPVAPITVTVTRIGTGNITNLAAALGGAASGDFTLSALDAATLDGTTTSATFTVKPNDALAPGTYLATVTVTADNGVSQGFNLSFTVNLPSAPTIQSAAAGDTHVNITWSSVPKATGYKIYQSTTPGSYGAERATVAGTVYSYDATGLVNGTTYFFVVRASIGIYDSVNSNEVGATPQVPAPGAPVLQTAAAGNGQVSLTWSAVDGSLGYNIYASMTSGVYTSPADTVAGSVYSCDVTGLNNGTTYYFAVTASNPGGESGYSNEISATPQAAVPGAPTGATATAGNGQATVSFTPPADNGGSAITGYTVTSSPGNITATGNGTTITVTGLSNGTAYTFTVTASNAAGTGPASAGTQVELMDIKVNIRIAESPADTVKIVEDTANQNNYQVVVKPVEFEITCTSGDKTVEVSRFSVYVERMIALPEGVDPSRVTTGVILNSDGTFSHVPTVITMIDGKYYAKINSLTNSAYSLIYSPKTFKDVENHWARIAVNDMASRLVVSGVGNDKFEPDRDITRAEFAAVIVKALGLMQPGTGRDTFGDVAQGAYYYDAVSIAYEYGIISGYGNGRFAPDQRITREQAMVMIAGTLKITGLEATFVSGEKEKILAGFDDAVQCADYARDSIAACLKTGIISGRTANLITPKDNITRAEVAQIVRSLLQKSKLI